MKAHALQLVSKALSTAQDQSTSNNVIWSNHENVYFWFGIGL